MQFETLLFAIENGTAIITINRPDKLNALNATVISELSKAIDEVYQNSAIQSAIITGSGAKSFVAGADISEFIQLNAAEGEALARKGQTEVFDKIAASGKPIIAAVNGFALGGGCELAMACHFIIAASTAKFGQPEVNLGLIPGYGGTQRLVQAIGKGRAMQLLMTGEMIGAEQAASWGLANKVVTPETLLEEAKQILQIIHAKAPLAIAKVVTCVNAFDHTTKGYETEIAAFGACFATADKVEGTTAFLEKRKPVFTGK